MLLGADVHEDLGPVVDHVDCSVFLSHLKLEDTVERLPSRHLALSLCAEDVKAQYEDLTPETRERLNNVLYQKEVDPDTNVSLAHAHGYLKISRNPLLRVYRDVPVKDGITHESEIDLSVEPRTSYVQATGEHDVISSTRKRRRLTHKSLRFKQIVLCPLVSKIMMKSELLLERLAQLALNAIYFLLPWRRVVNLVRPSLGETSTLSSSSRREVHFLDSLQQINTSHGHCGSRIENELSVEVKSGKILQGWNRDCKSTCTCDPVMLVTFKVSLSKQ